MYVIMKESFTYQYLNHLGRWDRYNFSSLHGQTDILISTAHMGFHFIVDFMFDVDGSMLILRCKFLG